MKTSRACVCLATFFAASVGCIHLAKAGFTLIKPNHKEPDQKQILDHLLGGDFIAHGMDFSNGSITAKRMDDASDQHFAGRIFEARAVARFSDYSQSFGCFDHGFEKLFDVTGNHYNVTGSAIIDMTHMSAFGRAGDSSADSSAESDNADRRDHVLTYKISGDGLAEKYLLFWEDLDLSPALSAGRTSRDFNDLVVEVTAQPGHLIPLPPAVVSGSVLGVVLVALWIRRAPTSVSS